MERIIFDYSRLKGRIVEKCGSQKAFAALLGISEPTLTAKLNCSSYFTQGEMLRAIDILDIDQGAATDYFFTVRV